MESQNFSADEEVHWPDDRRTTWHLSIAMAAVALVILIALFWNTVASAVSLWWGRPTYNYAFLIIPISAYLIWQKREEVRAETPVGSLWGTALTASFALFWLISDAIDINQGRHIAFVGMVLGVLLASFGWSIFKILLFPFLYLWLLVPTGTIFLPLLQQIATLISAEIATLARDSGICGRFLNRRTLGPLPYRGGLRGLELHPCSCGARTALRLSILSVLLETSVVVIGALVLAIVMNGVRIAGIIALAHWGGQRLNIVDDHLLYGWCFFALVLMGAGYAASFFADGEPSAPTKKQDLASLQ